MLNPIDAAIEAVVASKIGKDHPSAGELVSRYKGVAASLQCNGSRMDLEQFQKMMQDLMQELHSIR
jgi:hypothetical protein